MIAYRKMTAMLASPLSGKPLPEAESVETASLEGKIHSCRKRIRNARFIIL